MLRNGRGGNAQPIPESLALKSEFPKNEVPRDYILGIGDTVIFSRLLENNRSNDQTDNQWPVASKVSDYKLGIGDTLVLTLIKTTKPNQQLAPSSENQNVIVTPQQIDETINSTGRIGSDGSVLLLEVGRLEAIGKSLNELRSEVRNILIRNGVSPRFQLEIAQFKSQKAYLTVNTISTVVTLNDQITTLKDILTSARLVLNQSYHPHRKHRKEYSVLRDLTVTMTNIDVQSGDISLSESQPT